MGTAPHNIDTAISGLQQECDRLSAQPLDQQELQFVKGKLLGQYALSKQTNSQIAQAYGWYESLGLGIDFDHHFINAINHLTSHDLQHTAQKYLTTPTIVLVSREPSALW
jgi:predicted Zn-dependent peptidase